LSWKFHFHEVPFHERKTHLLVNTSPRVTPHHRLYIYSAFIQAAGTNHTFSVIRGIWPQYGWLQVMDCSVRFMGF